MAFITLYNWEILVCVEFYNWFRDDHLCRAVAYKIVDDIVVDVFYIVTGGRVEQAPIGYPPIDRGHW